MDRTAMDKFTIPLSRCNPTTSFRLARPAFQSPPLPGGHLEENDSRPNMGIPRISIPTPLVYLIPARASPLLMPDAIPLA
jgi:hypothetical protein